MELNLNSKSNKVLVEAFKINVLFVLFSPELFKTILFTIERMLQTLFNINFALSLMESQNQLAKHLLIMQDPS